MDARGAYLSLDMVVLARGVSNDRDGTVQASRSSIDQQMPGVSESIRRVPSTSHNASKLAAACGGRSKQTDETVSMRLDLIGFFFLAKADDQEVDSAGSYF